MYFQLFICKLTNLQYLLIINSHSSYVIAQFIAYYITSKIDLFLLLLYSLHKMQPLDLSIFKLLKLSLTQRLTEFSNIQLCDYYVQNGLQLISKLGPNVLSLLLLNPAFERLESICLILRSYYQLLLFLLEYSYQIIKMLVKLVIHLRS